jgi:hypothetical protein
VAIEVKRGSHFRDEVLATLRLFREDYPMARAYLFYGGARSLDRHGVHVMPLGAVLPALPALLRA